MDSDGDGYLLYRELAGWWPLISPVEEYAREAEYLARVFATAVAGVHEVLDLGSGGGHVAVHLKDRFAMTLVDLSPEMLATSLRLNPGCPHIQGDMRTVRLGRTFDAVLAHDAVDYITSESDLRKVVATAYAHCRPGGIAVFVPDHTAETFQPGTGGGGSGDRAGRHGSFRERTWDPHPGDDWVQAEYEFVLREADGTVRVVTETHRLGAFHSRTWLSLLSQAGLRPGPPPGPPAAGVAPGQAPAHLFIGHRVA